MYARITERRYFGKRISVNGRRYAEKMADRSRTEYAVRLRAARKHAGLTQHQLAAAVGMPQSTLSEAETTGQSSAYTPQLAKKCGVDAEWLATGEGQMVSSTAWPFRQFSLDDLIALEDASPGALAHVERTVLGLISLAGRSKTNMGVGQKPRESTVRPKVQGDTFMTNNHLELPFHNPSKSKNRDKPSSHPEQPHAERGQHAESAPKTRRSRRT